MVTDGEVHVSDGILPNTVPNESTGVSAVRPTPHIPAWTTDAAFPEDRNHRNTSKSEGAECSGPLMSGEPTGRFFSVATDPLNSQPLTGHTGKLCSLIWQAEPSVLFLNIKCHQLSHGDQDRRKK